jgi:hypothetical protein
MAMMMLEEGGVGCRMDGWMDGKAAAAAAASSSQQETRQRTTGVSRWAAVV